MEASQAIPKERKPWHFQPGNPGKAKGVRYKRSVETERAIQDAFNYLQKKPGIRLREWAEANPTLFYTQLYVKILPKNIDIKTDAASIPAIVGAVLTELAARYERDKPIEVEYKDVASTQEAEICEEDET